MGRISLSGWTLRIPPMTPATAPIFIGWRPRSPCHTRAAITRRSTLFPPCSEPRIWPAVLYPIRTGGAVTACEKGRIAVSFRRSAQTGGPKQDEAPCQGGRFGQDHGNHGLSATEDGSGHRSWLANLDRQHEQAGQASQEWSGLKERSRPLPVKLRINKGTRTRFSVLAIQNFEEYWTPSGPSE